MLSVDLESPLRFRSLTVFPLVTTARAELPYSTLADAMTEATLTITAIGDGVVREVIARNERDTDVLLLDGEQLIGARQNRMTCRSTPRERADRHCRWMLTCLEAPVASRCPISGCLRRVSRTDPDYERWCW